MCLKGQVTNGAKGDMHRRQEGNAALGSIAVVIDQYLSVNDSICTWQGKRRVVKR